MLDLDPGMMIWTWITFFVVLGLLSKLALKPILSAIESRENAIRSDIEEAKKQRDEAAALLDKHSEMINSAEAEAQKILRENLDAAEKGRQDLLENARAESAKVLDKALAEIEQQKQSALASLKAEVADLAIGAAEKIILQDLDEEKQKTVVDEYIKTMPKSLKN